MKLPRPPFDLDLLEGYTGNNDIFQEAHSHRDTMDNAVNWMTNHHDAVSSEEGIKIFDIDSCLEMECSTKD